MIKKIIQGFGWAVLILIFGIILIVCSPILIPMWIISELRTAIRFRRFRRREAGNFYLVCTSKRNWRDFLRNNVIPILPDNVRVVWHKSMRGNQNPDLQGFLNRSKIFAVSKPYLIAVTKQALRVKSLNADLQALKPHAKVSDEIRGACLHLIEATQKGF